MSSARIGIDVGGTNTDAVVVQDGKVLCSHKTPTTSDVTGGVVAAVEGVLSNSEVAADEVEGLMVGTTHFTNAVLERKHMCSVGVIRVALPSTAALPPLTDWPEDLRNIIGNNTHMVRGGIRYDGEVADDLDEQAVIECIRSFKQAGIQSVAVSGLFSPVQDAMETRVAEIVRQELPDAHLTISSTIGRIGLLDRENAAILNASLAELSTRVVASFREAFGGLGIDAPLFISQNDGTLMSESFVARYPVLTFASGPTNSMRGAGFLSDLEDAIVVDIGGTTTDVGVLTQGFPRESFMASDLGGVMTNFRMPDLLVLGLGGGSFVRGRGDQLSIGPESVGFKLTSQSTAFGGETLTATDLAVAAGYADIGDASLVQKLPKRLVREGIERIHQMVEVGIDRMKTCADPTPLVLVGGGSVLISRPLAGVSEVVVPDYAGVANAVGATIAKVSGEVDRVYSYEKLGRDAALSTAKDEAVKRALAAGASAGSVEVLEVEELPVAYVPGGAVRVRVKAAGDIGELTAEGC